LLLLLEIDDSSGDTRRCMIELAIVAADADDVVVSEVGEGSTIKLSTLFADEAKFRLFNEANKGPSMI
jgi:hypothetical protein